MKQTMIPVGCAMFSILFVLTQLACGTPEKRAYPNAGLGLAAGNRQIATESSTSTGSSDPSWASFKDRFLNHSNNCTADQSPCESASECCSFLCMSNSCVQRVFESGCRKSQDSCKGNFECCSGTCTAGRCIGSGDIYCSYVGQPCQDSSDCCSGACDTDRGACAGSAIECASTGMFCGSDSECCSDYCDQHSKQCMEAE